jgi:type IV secretory pathway VirD2 relaxase
MGTGKKLIKNTNERHEALKLHKVYTNKNRVTRELEETDNYGDGGDDKG